MPMGSRSTNDQREESLVAEILHLAIAYVFALSWLGTQLREFSLCLNRHLHSTMVIAKMKGESLKKRRDVSG